MSWGTTSKINDSSSSSYKKSCSCCKRSGLFLVGILFMLLLSGWNITEFHRYTLSQTRKDCITATASSLPSVYRETKRVNHDKRTQHERQQQKDHESFVTNDIVLATSTSTNTTITVGSVAATKRAGKAQLLELIHSYYEETFQHLVHYCDHLRTDVAGETSTNNNTKLTSGEPFSNQRVVKPMKGCIRNFITRYQILQPRSTSSASSIFPMWFKLMLRDVFDHAILFSPLHHAISIEPNITMCLIDKNSGSQFRPIFTSLNHNNKIQVHKRYRWMANDFGYNTEKYGELTLPLPKNEYNFTSFVVLRDPLERFLSAYLDKCIKRRFQGHCEPKVLFPSQQQLARPKNNLTSPEKYIRNIQKGITFDGKTIQSKQDAFEMFVNVMPHMAWNIHFYPQSLYCDGLYRFMRPKSYINDNNEEEEVVKDEERQRNNHQYYDHVLNMGPNYYRELELLTSHVGRQSRFSKLVYQKFNLTKHLKQNVTNVGVETAAPAHVKEYYTRRTLQKVLQFVSIDYVLLNLPIPEWAIEMLDTT